VSSARAQPLDGAEMSTVTAGLAGDASPEPVALEATGVVKHFFGTPALAGAHLTVRQGTVHALLGGNGSGKSTLIKILAGVQRGDSGQVHVLGRSWPAAGADTRRARDAGLRFVHQDLGLFDDMTVAENIALDSGFPLGPTGGVRWRSLRRQVGALLEQYQVEAGPDTLLGSLRPAQRTMVAVARALADQEGSEYVLVLDEPTASLPDHEATLLLTALKSRARHGQTVVFVTHHLREVIDVADDVTVLRDGRTVGTISGRTPGEEELVELIAGRSVARQRTCSTPVGDPVLVVDGLAVGPLRGLDLRVHGREIVGIAGLVGSGRTTALSSIFGARPSTAGSVTVRGTSTAGRGVVAAMRHGVAMVPEDRLRDAAFADLNVRENMSASMLPAYWRGWWRRRREEGETRRLLAAFAVKASGPDAPLLSLSGGNQQKVVLARWLQRDPALLLLDEPTQGVDIVSRADIYAGVRASAAAGCAVLIASSDFEELCLLCDRVLVLRDGHITHEVSGGDATPELLTRLVQSSPEKVVS